MSHRIDHSAIVHPDAVLDEGVTVGPFCVLGPGTFLGAGTRLESCVTIVGNARIGQENLIGARCVIGAEPQDLSGPCDDTWVVIGDHNVIGDRATIHRGTMKDVGITSVGSNNRIGSRAHIAHDCDVGSQVTLGASTQLSGHVQIQDHAIVSGKCGVVQFVTIAMHAMVCPDSFVRSDVPPFMQAVGIPSEITAPNLDGLRAFGGVEADVENLRLAHHLLYELKVGIVKARAELAEQERLTLPLRRLFDFLERQNAGVKGRARQCARSSRTEPTLPAQPATAV